MATVLQKGGRRTQIIIPSDGQAAGFVAREGENFLSQPFSGVACDWVFRCAALAAVFMPLAAVFALKDGPVAPRAEAEQAAQRQGEEWPVRPYSRMTQRLGIDVFDRATLRVPMVAQQVWAAGGCDRVEVVAIANQSTPRSVIYRVACHNGREAQVAVDFTART